MSVHINKGTDKSPCQRTLTLANVFLYVYITDMCEHLNRLYVFLLGMDDHYVAVSPSINAKGD